MSWLFVLAGILALYAGADIAVHRRLGSRRSPGQRLLLAVLCVGCAACAAVGIGGVVSGCRQSRSAQYLAYCYLQEGEGEAARAKAAQCTGTDARLLPLLADAVDRDYFSAWFEARQLLQTARLSGQEQAAVQRLLALCGGALGLQVEESTGQVRPLTGEALPLEIGTAAEASADAAAAETAVTEEQRHQQVLALVETVRALRQPDGQENERLQQLYSVERTLLTGHADALDAQAVAQLLQAYPQDEEALLLAARYYALQGDYDNACALAEQLVKKDASEANLVVYTDLIAQRALTGGLQPRSDDAQAQALLAQAERLEQRAAETDVSTPSGLQRYEKLYAQAQTLREEAARLDVARAVNFLLAKRPLTGDRTGLLDLQLAKLYLAMDDRETAQGYVWKVVDRAGTLPESSPLAQPLQQVAAASLKLEDEQGSPALSQAVRQTVEAQSRSVVPATDGSINGTMVDYMTSTIKYSRLQVFVSRIDTSAYPTVRAFANVSGEKDKAFGQASDFGAEDFELIDTQYPIADFRLVTDAGARQISVALVVDTSGSMDGVPIQNARLAAEACVDHLEAGEQKLSVVAYNSQASVVVDATDSAETLTNGIRGLTSGGGTNIASGIRAGLDTLQEGAGVKAMILLSDGLDNSAGELEGALEAARQKGAAIFTVGLGEADGAYLRGISEVTGGKYIAAANATELSDIYRMLQKYIVNNYCFEYTVTANPQRDPRLLTVGVPEYHAQNSRAYRISGEAVTEEELSSGARPFEDGDILLSSLTPGGVAGGDLKNGVTVTLRGAGFHDGMAVSVGGLTVTGLTCSTDTEATGTLAGSLQAGQYDVRLTAADGRVEILSGGLRVFDAGVVQSVQLGNLLVLADAVGALQQDADGRVTALAASGSVSINGFLHSTGELQITPAEPLAADSLKSGGTAAVYLGRNGSMQGDGKLYVSYAQTAQTGGALGSTFAEQLLGGRDLVVRSGYYTVRVEEGRSDFGGDQPVNSAEAWKDYTVKIPGLADMFATSVSLYDDRLQLDSDLLDIGDIEDNLVKVVTGGAWSTKKDKEALEKQLGDWGKVKGSAGRGRPGVRTYELDGKLSVALGASDVRVGGEVTLKLESTKKFFLFPLKAVTVKLNSLDPKLEYWKLGVKFLLPGVESFAGVSQDSVTLDAALASYLWYPDSLTLNAELEPGIRMFEVMNLTKVGGGFTGGSRLWTDADTPQGEQDVTLRAVAEADINLFKWLGLPTQGAMRSVSRWGEMGKFSNGEAVVNFTDGSISIGADLELLQQKVASAKILLDAQKLSVDGSLDAVLQAAGISLSGSIKPAVRVQWGSSDGGVSVRLTLQADGGIQCDWADFDYSGECGVELTNSVYSGSVILSLRLYAGDNWARAWYDSNGRYLWDKVHFDGNF